VPSGIGTGPSGNAKPSATSSTSTSDRVCIRSCCTRDRSKRTFAAKASASARELSLPRRQTVVQLSDDADDRRSRATVDGNMKAEQRSNIIRELTIVLAKAPVPGRAKTRLCPPCTPENAARLAQASLLDTLNAVEEWGGQRVLALDQCGTDFSIDGWNTIGQPDGGLDVRLDGVFAEVFTRVNTVDRVETSVFLVGMDTPQIAAADLSEAFDALRDTDAVIGPASDGGYWGIGFTAMPNNAFVGVPMSTDATFDAQVARLHELGLRVAVLRQLDDIDTFDDATRVGAAATNTRVGQLVREPNWWISAAT
jgi:uncharacterized protein